MATLFHDTKSACDTLLYVYSLMASKEFIDCADRQLTDQFIKVTGLKPGKNVSIAFTKHHNGAPIYSDYIIPNTNFFGRKLCIAIFINHNWNPVTIFWKSKIGKDYKLHDINIDCSDIEFWFERLDTDLYIKQLYPNQKLPFKTDNLTFELEVVRLNMDATLTFFKKAGCHMDTTQIATDIDTFIATFNEKSETHNRKYGLVHNWKANISETKITLDIDLGSAGVVFYKPLLNQLAKMNCLSKVVIE